MYRKALLLGLTLMVIELVVVYSHFLGSTWFPEGQTAELNRETM